MSPYALHEYPSLTNGLAVNLLICMREYAIGEPMSIQKGRAKWTLPLRKEEDLHL
jgi:hypothetical protein